MELTEADISWILKRYRRALKEAGLTEQAVEYVDSRRKVVELWTL